MSFSRDDHVGLRLETCGQTQVRYPHQRDKQAVNVAADHGVIIEQHHDVDGTMESGRDDERDGGRASAGHQAGGDQREEDVAIPEPGRARDAANEGGRHSHSPALDRIRRDVEA